MVISAKPPFLCWLTIKVLENYQVTNGVNMYYLGYCYGITPGSFPLSVLYCDADKLGRGREQATNWYVIDRVADMQS